MGRHLVAFALSLVTLVISAGAAAQPVSREQQLRDKVEALERTVAELDAREKKAGVDALERALQERDEARRARLELEKALQQSQLMLEGRINSVEFNAVERLGSRLGLLVTLTGILAAFGVYKGLQVALSKSVSEGAIRVAEQHANSAIATERKTSERELLIGKATLFQRLGAECWAWYSKLHPSDPQRGALAGFARNITAEAVGAANQFNLEELTPKQQVVCVEARSQHVYHRIELHRLGERVKDYAIDIMIEAHGVYAFAEKVRTIPEFKDAWYFWSETYAWACKHSPAADTQATALKVARELYLAKDTREDFRERLVLNYFDGQPPTP